MTTLHRTFDQAPLIPGLAPLFITQGCRRQFRRGQIIRHAGHPADSVDLLIAGCVSRCLERADTLVILELHGPGELIGPLSDKAAPADNTLLWARLNTTLYRLPHRHFVQLAARDARLSRYALHQLSEQLHRARHRCARDAWPTARERVLGALTELADGPLAEPGAAGLSIAITREELGQFAGCSRKTATRALRELAAIGALRLNGRRILLRHEFSQMSGTSQNPIAALATVNLEHVGE